LESTAVPNDSLLQKQWHWESGVFGVEHAERIFSERNLIVWAGLY
jgi:hypothetical protein